MGRTLQSKIAAARAAQNQKKVPLCSAKSATALSSTPLCATDCHCLPPSRARATESFVLPPVRREHDDDHIQPFPILTLSQCSAALQPRLKECRLEQKTVLHEAGDLTKAVYFPITAVISLVVALSTGEMTEAAMVGRDGAVGLASALDSNIAFSRA